MGKTQFFTQSEAAVDALIEKVGKDIRVIMPVGLGKANRFMNTLYKRAVEDSTINLEITSALELEIPTGKSELEQKFFKPVQKRLWSETVELDYFKGVRNGTLPDNVKIFNLYAKSGQILDIPDLQKNYLNYNYTQIGRNGVERGWNVACSLFSKRETKDGVLISPGTNSDLYFGTVDEMKNKAKIDGRKIAAVGEINPNSPFLYGDDTQGTERFDILLEGEETNYPLFTVPKASVTTTDHMIGIYVSSLVRDGGTIQIGIGALGDAIANSTIMRHKYNKEYKKIIENLNIEKKIIEKFGGTKPFEQGILGSSEMFVESFIPMFKEGVLTRKIYDNLGLTKLINNGTIKNGKIPKNIIELLMGNGEINGYIDEKQFKNLQTWGILKDDLKYKDVADTLFVAKPENLKKVQSDYIGKELKNGYCINGAFFLGSNDFYDFLRDMDEGTRKLIRMDSVLKINTLYGNEKLRRAQRKHARFFNTGMKLTLLGSVASDQLEDGRMISGVGGQFNFVEMGQALSDGHSIILIKSTKGVGKKLISNIVYSYGHSTIPRHLKDVIVTEYGIADVRDKTDEETIAAIINIADSRFQNKLLKEAKGKGKISEDYVIPEEYTHNTPEALEEKLATLRKEGFFKPFPFGADFTEDELVVAVALKKAKLVSETDIGKILKALIKKVPEEKIEKAKKYLDYMEFDKLKGKDFKVFMFGLEETGRL